ncbi:TrkA C-terminal domain-containing protein [Candidatus Leptofilum sp.]|uniref:TrkA C-terminal domain-containing protein n=1 Tax=Candidatus Leptofilum sp. TaxID=3241576 RepID=UPI003B5B9D36
MMNPEIGNWWYTLSGLKKQHTANIHQIAAADKPSWIGKTVTELHQETEVLTLAVKRDDKFLTPPPATLTIEATDILITLIAK